jgi:hypothetical protein
MSPTSKTNPLEIGAKVYIVTLHDAEANASNHVISQHLDTGASMSISTKQHGLHPVTNL